MPEIQEKEIFLCLESKVHPALRELSTHPVRYLWGHDGGQNYVSEQSNCPFSGERKVSVVSSKSWLCWLPIWNACELKVCGPGSLFPLLVPVMEQLLHLNIIIHRIHTSPFLRQGCSQSWLQPHYPVAVLSPSLCNSLLISGFHNQLPEASWIFLSSVWDLAHCPCSPGCTHLLRLNPLTDLGKRRFSWQLLPETHISKGQSLTLTAKIRSLGQIHHRLTSELGNAFPPARTITTPSQTGAWGEMENLGIVILS